MDTNNQVDSDDFEPVELLVYYINQEKVDIILGLFMTAKELADAYVKPKVK